MELESDELEDGEIVDYTPLERPAVLLPNGYGNGATTSQSVSSDEASQASSSSEEDSDAEPNMRPKKQKLSKRKFKFTNTKACNKYNVWSIGLQEDALSENLGNCDVDAVDRSRDVESYDYQMKYRVDPEQDQMKDDNNSRRNSFGNNKRRYGENRNQRHIRQGSFDTESCAHNKQHYSKGILELTVSESDSPEEVALDICTKLSETKHDIIARVVNILGTKKAIEVYNETKLIEDDGGMLVMNGSRRRTPGGVYLHILKSDNTIPREVAKQIFLDDRYMTEQIRKRKKKANKTKQSLRDDILPTLLTRAELEMKRLSDAAEGEHAVSNPPPSPATDCDNSDTANVQSQQIVSYDDDFLQLNTVDDDIEFF